MRHEIMAFCVRLVSWGIARACKEMIGKRRFSILSKACRACREGFQPRVKPAKIKAVRWGRYPPRHGFCLRRPVCRRFGTAGKALFRRRLAWRGMEVDDAFTLSDSYIRQCELLPSPERIINLQYRMLVDYAQRVERLRVGSKPAKLVLEVANYVQHHLSEAITTGQVADALYLSRAYLSRKFKAVTGESLTDFVLKEKTEEAKRLLRYTDKSLTAISAYLGFSSPSHFSRVFRKYAGIRPRDYRAQRP